MPMLHTIRTGPLGPPAEEPLELLLACHVRLRSFSALSLALATRTDLPPAEMADAAQRLLRYFQVALPLHEADEEDSLAPALLATSAGSRVQDALGTMAAQHEQLHEILDALIPAWEGIAAAASEANAPRAVGVPAQSEARGLSNLIELHLDLEEKLVFPAITLIEPAARKRLFAEIRGRRTPEVMATMQQVLRAET